MRTIEMLSPQQTGDWRSELANAINSPRELLLELGLQHMEKEVIPDASFSMRVPRAYARKIRKRDADDPLLKQILPDAAEQACSGIIDPVGDLDAMPVPGLLHKYKGRALLVTTGACAVHCRYCFRRHFPYSGSNPRKNEWQRALEYLNDHGEIREVVLSGGDPLMLDNARLKHLLQALETVPHIDWLRIHTRMPVVLPSRIDPELVAMLQQSRFRTTVVIHANHANELATAEFEALQRLTFSGSTLLNQSVLLKGVNDSAAAIIALSKKLHQARVLPYYLHLLDPVQGAMHFDVPEKRAVDIVNTVKKELPGFLVPRLVREIPGKPSKTAISTI